MDKSVIGLIGARFTEKREELIPTGVGLRVGRISKENYGPERGPPICNTTAVTTRGLGINIFLNPICLAWQLPEAAHRRLKDISGHIPPHQYSKKQTLFTTVCLMKCRD